VAHFGEEFGPVRAEPPRVFDVVVPTVRVVLVYVRLGVVRIGRGCQWPRDPEVYTLAETMCVQSIGYFVG
jgi:hypothetical protein